MFSNHFKIIILLLKSYVKNRIIESPRLEKALRSSSSIIHLSPILPTKPFPSVQAVSSSTWPIPQRRFPNVQPESPLAQLEAIHYSPTDSYMGEEVDFHLTTTPLQLAVESNKATPQTPLLQAAQSQLPQPLLIRLVLHTPPLVYCWFGAVLWLWESHTKDVLDILKSAIKRYCKVYFFISIHQKKFLWHIK